MIHSLHLNLRGGDEGGVEIQEKKASNTCLFPFLKDFIFFYFSEQLC